MNYVSKLISILGVLAISCLTPYDFYSESFDRNLIITGQISNLAERNVVQIGITRGTNALPQSVSNAQVKLVDENKTEYLYSEDYNRPGFYFLTQFAGEPGKTYHLHIRTVEGKTYQSLPEKMPDQVGTVSTSSTVAEEQVIGTEGGATRLPFLKIYANTELEKSNLPTLLKWSIEETFILSPTDFPDIMGSIPPPCYITQRADPQRITLFDGQNVGATEIKDQLVGSRLIDWTFLEKHSLTVYQSSITKEAFEYWRQVNILANQVGSIFDSPPAKITGNLFNTTNSSESVLGYFQATLETSDRFVTYPYELPFPLLLDDCDFRGYNVNYLPRCLNCLTVPNSSYERPFWF
jgi:Domain of unknown function (DUF4249)